MFVKVLGTLFFGFHPRKSCLTNIVKFPQQFQAWREIRTHRAVLLAMACNKAKATTDTEAEALNQANSTADGTVACNNASDTKNRGGARRKSITPLSQDALDSVFAKAVAEHKHKAFDLRDYDHMKTSQAASSVGLQHCQWWLKNLLPLCDGAILPLQLRSSLLKHCVQYNDSHYKHDLWATRKASQFGVLLNHWRRLKHDADRQSQLKKKSTPTKHKVMDELLSLEPGVCPGEAWKSQFQGGHVRRGLQESRRGDQV